MRTITQIGRILVLFAILQVSVSQTQNQKRDSAGVLLQRAIRKEVVDGDLQSAIEQYKAIVTGYPADRAVVAQALIRMAGCYQRQGTTEARKIYQRVVDEFSDQKQASEQARVQLGQPGNAGLPEAIAPPRMVCPTCGDEEGSTSWNGRFMAATDGYGIAPGDLAVRNIGTNEIHVLASQKSPGDGTNANAMLSPDLTQIVYSWSFANLTQLRIIPNKDAAKPRTLVQNPEILSIVPAGWKSDGRSILTTITKSDGASLAWVSAMDGSVRTIKALGTRLRGIKSRPSLSPDGAYIAYSALAGSPTAEQIYIVAADGSGPETELVKGDNINESPIWSPDGSGILFISNRASDTFDLRSIAVRGGKPDGVPQLVWKAIGRISPNGMSKSGIYYFTQKQTNLEQIVVAEMDASGTRIKGGTVQRSENLKGSMPSWSPDGDSIAVKRRRQVGVFFTVVYPLLTGEPRIFDQPGITRNQAQWLHDNSGFLETLAPALSETSTAPNGTGTLYHVDLEKGQFSKILDFGPSLFTNTMGLFFQLSPDDSTIYMFGYETGDTQTANRLLAIDLKTGQQKQLFKLPRNGIALKLSPNGQTLAIVSNDETGTYLSRVGVDGKNYLELSSLRNSQFKTVRGILAWSKGGTGVLFVQEESPIPPVPGALHHPTDVTTQRIMYMPADGGGVPQFTGLEVASGRVQEISVNEDKKGSRIAYGLFGSGAPELWSIDLSSLFQKQK